EGWFGGGRRGNWGGVRNWRSAGAFAGAGERHGLRRVALNGRTVGRTRTGASLKAIEGALQVGRGRVSNSFRNSFVAKPPPAGFGGVAGEVGGASCGRRARAGEVGGSGR